jgi:hypothetical protein
VTKVGLKDVETFVRICLSVTKSLLNSPPMATKHEGGESVIAKLLSCLKVFVRDLKGVQELTESGNLEFLVLLAFVEKSEPESHNSHNDNTTTSSSSSSSDGALSFASTIYLHTHTHTHTHTPTHIQAGTKAIAR